MDGIDGRVNSGNEQERLIGIQLNLVRLRASYFKDLLCSVSCPVCPKCSVFTTKVKPKPGPLR